MTDTFEIEGLTLQTGDLLCTMNGKPDILPGEFWRLVGRLVPGDVDHIVIYAGPGGRCVEAGSRGVITFDLPGRTWDTDRMSAQRGHLVDTLYGVASPLDGLDLSEEDETRMREAVADYALAQVGKPYNLNFLDAETERAFYCSQLAYKAYQRVGINLNTGLSIEHFPGTNAIVYPQEIWEGSAHRAVPLPHVLHPSPDGSEKSG
ncbi:MAG: YiiX/YebB-like N1pC/P60 family cysteine hydrolase [Bacteroidota bacterium]